MVLVMGPAGPEEHAVFLNGTPALLESRSGNR